MGRGILALDDRAVQGWLQGKRALFAKRRAEVIPYGRITSVESSVEDAGTHTLTRINAGTTWIIKTYNFVDHSHIRAPASLLAALLAGEPFPSLDRDRLTLACSLTEATPTVRSMLECRAAIGIGARSLGAESTASFLKQGRPRHATAGFAARHLGHAPGRSA